MHLLFAKVNFIAGWDPRISETIALRINHLSYSDTPDDPKYTQYKLKNNTAWDQYNVVKTENDNAANSQYHTKSTDWQTHSKL